MEVNFEGQKANQFLSKKQTTFYFKQFTWLETLENEQANHFWVKSKLLTRIM